MNLSIGNYSQMNYSQIQRIGKPPLDTCDIFINTPLEKYFMFLTIGILILTCLVISRNKIKKKENVLYINVITYFTLYGMFMLTVFMYFQVFIT